MIVRYNKVVLLDLLNYNVSKDGFCFHLPTKKGVGGGRIAHLLAPLDKLA
jgi:hypothetical protein